MCSHCNGKLRFANLVVPPKHVSNGCITSDFPLPSLFSYMMPNGTKNQSLMKYLTATIRRNPGMQHPPTDGTRVWPLSAQQNSSQVGVLQQQTSLLGSSMHAARSNASLILRTVAITCK
ncbi:hypothetical protein POM88_000864 [Heracleum sosnowskyi]|uniref:Uncharacterized protein n=1 Tax=Heracleum sosnowskyi TaxID=360622 RepID=A0AAD8JBX6_9APIA|nr:hypothetical protein POM88_000864 [Heracleum sosnowskyi]